MLAPSRLEAILKELCSLQCNPDLTELRAPRASRGLGACAHFLASPSQGSKQGDFYFGIDEQGYPLVRPRLHSAWWAWHSKHGDPLPQRVHRLVLAAQRDQLCLHKCDNPACLRPSHLYLGSSSDNLNDQFKRKRRSTRAVQGAAVSDPGTILLCRQRGVQLPPLLPATEREDRAFPLVGWHSPAKAAKRAHLSPSG